MLEVPQWVLLAVAIVWGLLGWVVLPRLTFHQWAEALHRGDFDDVFQRNMVASLQGAGNALVDSAADFAAQRVKGAIGGVASGEARLEKGLEGAMARDVLTLQSPVAAELLKSQFPEVHRFVTRHPEMVQDALSLVQSYIEKPAQPGSSIVNVVKNNGQGKTSW